MKRLVLSVMIYSALACFWLYFSCWLLVISPENIPADRDTRLGLTLLFAGFMVVNTFLIEVHSDSQDLRSDLIDVILGVSR